MAVRSGSNYLPGHGNVGVVPSLLVNTNVYAFSDEYELNNPWMNPANMTDANLNSVAGSYRRVD